MRMPVRALCVLTACSALAGVASGSAEAREPFDVFVSTLHSPFLRTSDTYVRTRPGGSIRVTDVLVHNVGPARAPATTVGFSWKKDGAIVATVSVRAMGAGERRTSGPVRVPLPARDGRYYMWLCADTPRAGPPERRDNNCLKVYRLVIVNRKSGSPNPGGTVLLDVAPISWNFGSVAPGTSSEAQNFTVRNLGEGDTGPGSVVIAGGGSGAFEIGSNGCNPGLSGTSACRIRVTFTPPAPGSYPAELVVTFAKGELRVSLSGTGG